MRNCDIKHWYNRFNKKFFSSALPNIPVRYKQMAYRGSMGEADFARKWVPIEIRIEPGLAKTLGTKQSIVTLLHEMCHVSCAIKYKKNIGHGPKFRREIDRLYRAGAYTRYKGGLL